EAGARVGHVPEPAERAGLHVIEEAVLVAWARGAVGRARSQREGRKQGDRNQRAAHGSHRSFWSHHHRASAAAVPVWAPATGASAASRTSTRCVAPSAANGKRTAPSSTRSGAPSSAALVRSVASARVTTNS